MAVAFATAGAGAASTSTTVDVPYPISISAGDLLVLHVEGKFNATWTTPAGWTDITGQANNDISSKAFYKIAGGSESGNLTVTVSGTTSNGHVGRMYRFTGVDATTQIEGAAVASGQDTTIPDTGVTTTAADRLAVNLVALSDTTSSLGSFAGETGGNWAEAIAEYSNASGSLQLQTATIAAAGTINGGSDAIDSTRFYGVIGFAILPGIGAVIGLASETDIAFSITPALTPSGVFAAVGLATETDSAFSITPSLAVAADIEFYTAIDFGSGYELLEDRVRAASIRRGRQSNLDRVEAATANTLFKNGDGLLDPANTASVYHGKIRPLVPLRILRREGGITYERFTGPIERWMPEWIPPSYQEMEVQAADSFETLANFTLVSDTATLTTSLTGSNNDLVFTAREAGARGDEITVEYVVAGTSTPLDGETNEPLTGSAVLASRPPTSHDWAVQLFAGLRVRNAPPPTVFTVQGTDISITVSTDGSGNPTATASQIKTFIEATPDLDALVSVALAPGNSGAGVVTALAQTNLTGGKWPQELSGARIARILDLAGWPTDLRDIDIGDYQVIPSGFSVRDNVSALQHIQDVADSELGYVFMRGNNTFVYHDASHRNVDPRSTASQATFSNTGTGFGFQAIQLPLDKDRIINEATVTAGAEGAVPQTAADTYSQTGSGTPPVDAPVVPPPGYGVRAVSRTTLLVNDADCLAQAEAIVTAFAYPVQRVESLTTVNTGADGWVEAALSLEIGDLITLVAQPPIEGGEGVTTSYELFVEAITDDYAVGMPLALTFATTASGQSVAADPPESDLYVLNNLGGTLIVGDAVNGIIAA